MKEQENLLVKKESEIKYLNEKNESLLIKSTEYERDITNIYDNVYNNYSESLKDKEKEFVNVEINPGKITNNLTKLNAEIKNLGSVNLMAIEDFKEIESRLKNIESQKDDILKAKEDLIKIDRT